MVTRKKRKTSQRSKMALSKVALVKHDKHPALRCFRLVDNKHTGRLIHHRHTSHLVLVIILLVFGFFLHINGLAVQASTKSGAVSVGVTVSGPAPTVGAFINSPVKGTKLTDVSMIDVSGTCPKGTFITVTNNGILAGSTMCTEAGIFTVRVQPQIGKNVLSVLDYDNLNQVGPTTPSVMIEIVQTTISAGEVPAPVLPTNPSVITGVDYNKSDCDDYKIGTLPTGGEPHVAVVCVPRTFGPNVKETLGILVWGGSSPYAMNINYGNSSDPALVSVARPGYHKVSFSYSSVGIYKITLKLTDQNNRLSIVQTAVQVNGETVKTPLATVVNNTLSTTLLETPVPLYMMTVAITLGFWGGDIFDRNFGASKPRRKSRKIA